MLVARGTGQNAKKAAELLVEAGRIAENLLHATRDVCNRLRPRVLDDLGLVAGVSVHLNTFGKRTGLTVNSSTTPSMSTGSLPSCRVLSTA